MKIYTIATEFHENHGHGDYSSDFKISKLGAYAQGQWPPAYRTREEAERGRTLLGHYPRTKVVELEVQ